MYAGGPCANTRQTHVPLRSAWLGSAERAPNLEPCDSRCRPVWSCRAVCTACWPRGPVVYWQQAWSSQASLPDPRAHVHAATGAGAVPLSPQSKRSFLGRTPALTSAAPCLAHNTPPLILSFESSQFCRCVNVSLCQRSTWLTTTVCKPLKWCPGKIRYYNV